MTTVKILRAKRSKKESHEYYCSVCFEEVTPTTEKCPACGINFKGIYEQDLCIGKR